jgi:hypothetical protein
MVSQNIDHLIKDLLELIILDAIIGNGDRHQENWAIIAQNLPDLAERISPLHKNYLSIKQFSPIYDSGSSLGRELLPEKIELFLTSPEVLKRYISKGTSEIHWQDKKVSHFDLIRNLLNSKHGPDVKNIIQRVIAKFDGTKIERILEEIDQEVPETHAEYRIPEARKRLIYKIITLRFEMLRTIINEGI